MACQARLDTVPYVGLPNVPYSQCEEWCKAGTALGITDLDVCSIAWNNPVPWRKIAGDFGEGAIMEEWAGYVLVLGFGVFFSIVTTIMVKLEQIYGGLVISSEHFNTAGRNIKTGLTAAVIVSQWTWAATLLQSSNVASQYGLSGPFWYAAGATVQILLFGILAIEIKKKAPNMHTFLEMIDVRWGKKAHMTFLFFGICTNLIVTGMLLQGGAAVVNAASGMHIIAANFLIPVGVILYTWFGGLKATFLASYIHTSVIMICLVVFITYVYAVPGDIECTSATEKQCNALGSAALLWERLRFLNYLPSKTDQGIPVNSTYTMPFPDGAYVPTADNPGPGAWESLVYVKEDYHHGPVNGNRGGSYLTMLSEGGLSFGVVNIVGNFGTVFVDQSYWQSAIAARPSSAHRGYLLGGLVWFTIPMSLATALGLSSLALNVKMPAAEAGAGLAPPAAAIVLLGQGGGIMIIIMLFMAITSTGSAECIAVASLFAYDIYRKYIKPDCTGAELLKVSRLVVVGYGIVCGLFGYFLYGVGVGLGWVYCFMGTMIGSAVIPVSCCLCTRYMTANGAMAGAWLGQILALVSWMAVAASRCTDGSDPDDFVASDDYPTCETGSLDVNTLGNINAQTTGSIVALCVSGIIAFVVAAIEYKSGKEQPFEWETMREGIKRVEQVKDELPEFEMTAEYLDPAAKYVFKYGVGYSVFLIFVWPLAVIAWGVFDKANYTLWASVAYCWGYIGSLVIVVLPVYESWGSLQNVLTCTKPAPEAKE
jgi:Na+/proline symporter